jgi:hypothetical protein
MGSDANARRINTSKCVGRCNFSCAIRMRCEIPCCKTLGQGCRTDFLIRPVLSTTGGRIGKSDLRVVDFLLADLRVCPVTPPHVRPDSWPPAKNKAKSPLNFADYSDGAVWDEFAEGLRQVRKHPKLTSGRMMNAE